LSELAAVGFTRLNEMQATARAIMDGVPSRSRAMGLAYVTFARTHPGLFALMFRSERLDTARPALRDAIDAAAQGLRSSSVAPDQALSPLQRAAQAAARWSLVHGFAMLLLDGRFSGLIASLPDGDGAGELLDAVLAVTRFDG